MVSVASTFREIDSALSDPNRSRSKAVPDGPSDILPIACDPSDSTSDSAEELRDDPVRFPFSTLVAEEMI